MYLTHHGLTRLSACAALALHVGCASSGGGHVWHGPPSATQASVVEPGSDTARDILERLDDLPAGVSTPVGRAQVTADESYAAASGRRCRSVAWTSAGAEGQAEPQRRLACRDRQQWFYVPNVGLVNTGYAPEPSAEAKSSATQTPALAGPPDTNAMVPHP